MYRVTPLPQYQLSISTTLALQAPHHTHWECISILLCSRFTTSVPCKLLLLRTLRSPVTKFFALVARKFLLCSVSSPFHGFTGIHFHRIRLLLVIFMGIVSLQLNCTELLNEQINSLCASMNSNANILETVVFLTKCVQSAYVQKVYFHCASPICCLCRQTVFAA